MKRKKHYLKQWKKNKYVWTIPGVHMKLCSINELKEQGTMIIIAGMIAVLLILSGEIADLFKILENFFKR